MIVLHTFCSPHRATGKTEMMLSFIRRNSKKFILSNKNERWQFNKILKEFNFAFSPVKDFVSSADSLRNGLIGYSSIDIDIVISNVFIQRQDSAKSIQLTFDCLKASRNNINVYIESDNAQDTDKFISAIKPDSTLIFDDYLYWNENHHAIGDSIRKINEEKERIEKSGFKFFSILNGSNYQ